MDRNQQYLTNLLYKVPSWELSDPPQQDMFEKIRVSLSNTMDFPGQLKSLYRVQNFSELALGLMWIAEKVDRDPSKLESTAEEEGFVLALLKSALGGAPATAPAPDRSFGLEGPQPSMTESFPTKQPSVGVDSFGADSSTASSSAGSGDANEQEFSLTLEKLVEAIQGGSADRTLLLDELTHEAEGIVSSGSADTEYKTFCGYLIEFLKYVSTNELFDDIRVMNLLSNVYDPFSQWARTEPAARSGILEQANEMLRDFKALFE